MRWAGSGSPPTRKSRATASPTPPERYRDVPRVPPSKSMQCSRCQTENREGPRFCSKCGAALALACVSCGFTNEPSDEFCGGCGALLRSSPPAQAKFGSPESYTPKHLAEKILTSKAALEGERNQVTVLFADLKGSMELLADRDPEEARKILD